jgi:membrane-associated phospholipid phosphatase
MELQRTSSKSGDLSIASWSGLLAIQDIIMLGYLVFVWALVWASPSGATQTACSLRLSGCAACVLLGAVFARGVVEVSPRIRSLVYRVALAGVLLEGYLMLRDVLPLIRADQVDASLYALDLRLFGVEPAVWLQRYNTLGAVEYFAFFYFSYFAICIAYLVGVVFVGRLGRRAAEFTIGTMVVYLVGQLGYMAVPAYGPVVALKDAFAEPIHGGFFWSCVQRTVEAGGAMKDVFPSLHTAAPLWFALFAREQAKTDRRFVWPARVTFFFSANIIFSTMFLRWHYVVDVIAGVALALLAGHLAPRLARWERRRRIRAGLPDAWMFR